MTHYDLSTRSELEPLAVVIASLQELAQPLGIELLVVGAVARDVIVRAMTGAPPVRETDDLDIAVSVSSWQEVDRLTGGLQPSDDGVVHRFRVLGVKVDFVPFGAIESDDRSITWPNGNTMSVLGFREARPAADLASLPGDVVIAIPSLAAQSVLKAVAWKDRRLTNSRDAVDLATLLDLPSSPSQISRLYEQHGGVVLDNDFDPASAGAQTVGMRSAQLLGTHGTTMVLEAISDARTLDLLAGDMRGNVGKHRAVVEAYVRGLRRGIS